MKHCKRSGVCTSAYTIFVATLLALAVAACDSAGAGGGSGDGSPGNDSGGGGDSEDTTAPGEISALSASSTNRQVSLSWNDPSDEDLDYIEITWGPADGESQPQNADAGDESFAVTGLSNGTQYTFTLEAVDSSGNVSNGVSVDAVPQADLSSLFAAASTSLTRVRKSSSAIGDLNGDNRADLLITGEDSNLDATAIVYENQGGLSFGNASSGLTGADNGASVLGDLDNDGDLDIVITGDDPNGNDVAKVYRNDGGFGFTERSTYITGVSSGTVSLGDLDGDDDLDIVVTGIDESAAIAGERITEIRENARSYFTQGTTTALAGVNQSSSSLGDLDGDNDLDLVITGNNGNGPTTAIYKNEGSFTFTDVSAGVTAVDNGSTALADLDGDEDLDLIIAGQNTQDAEVALVYENTGGFNFSDASAGLAGVRNSSITAGDLDGDGDVDVVITGNDGNGPTTTVYENEGDFSFSKASAGITGVETGATSLGDLDGDSDLDLLITGDRSSMGRLLHENGLY